MTTELTMSFLAEPKDVNFGGLIMKDHVATVCEMLIPYPQVLQIR